MKKVVLFEGPDGVGKTTQIEMLLKDDTYRFNLLAQPNSCSPMSFREEVFSSDKLTGLEAQLLFSLSHMYDLYEYISKITGDLIMDRSFISGLIYGSVACGGRNEFLSDVVHRLSELHKAYMASMDVNIVFLLPEKRFNNESDDVFEKTLKWGELRDGYLEVVDYMDKENVSMFSRREKVLVVDNSKLTAEETYARIRNFVS